MNEEKVFRKNFIWNMIGGTIYPFVSFFLLIIVTRINGENDAGIFTFSFTLTLLFAYISQYFGRTYQVTDNTNKFRNKDYILNRYITCIISIIIIAIVIVINNYDAYKIKVIVLLTIWRTIESIIEVFFGMLHKDDKLYKVGISLTLRTILSLTLFALIDYYTKDLVKSISMLIFSVIIVFIVYDFKNIKEYINKTEKYSLANAIKILESGFWTFGITVLSYYYINSAKLSLDGAVANDTQAIFGILLMPTTVMLLFNQYIIAPLLTKINIMIKESNYIKLKHLTTKLILLVLGLGIITTVLGITIGITLMELIYGVPLREYDICFTIILIGAVFYSMSYLLSNIMVSMRKNTNQFYIYLILSIISFFIAPIISKIGMFSVSVLYMLQMLILIIIFIIMVYYYLKKEIKNGKK